MIATFLSGIVDEIDMIPVPLSFMAVPRMEKPGRYLLYINIRDAKAAECF